MTPADHDLMNYITIMATMRLKHVPIGSRFVYGGMEDLLRRHGRLFTPGPYPDTLELGTPKFCFDNAYRLARRFNRRKPESRLYYAEGIAQGRVIPCHHAWCVTADGHVVDPTWDFIGPAYCGIVFPLDLVRQHRTKAQCSVLDDWRSDYRIFREPFTVPQDFGYAPVEDTAPVAEATP